MVRATYFWAILTIALSCFLTACAVSHQYIAEALQHAERAVTYGELKDTNALAEQATVALRYAHLAEKNMQTDGQLQEAIMELKEAVRHARYGRSDAGMRAAEKAATLLGELQ
ncbi:MAG: hypothetical protein M3Z35_06085 [Nitrospirota bacterium]|nr:hypothetical protein [Nitrospirota bacterium]